MGQRGATARFMASTWVFPGGAVDPIDHDPANLALVGVADPDTGPWIAAAVRELIEEVGVWLTDDAFVARDDAWLGEAVYQEARRRGVTLHGDRLALFANWITPLGLPMRFDTRFFAATVAGHLDPDPDVREIDRARWIDVDEAIERGRDGDMLIPLPTMKTLEYMSAFATGDVVVAHARTFADIAPILPKVRLGADGSMGIVLPTENGYDDLDHLTAESRDALRQAARGARLPGERIPEAE